MKKIKHYTSNIMMKGGVVFVSRFDLRDTGGDDDDLADYPGPFGVE